MARRRVLPIDRFGLLAAVAPVTVLISAVVQTWFDRVGEDVARLAFAAALARPKHRPRGAAAPERDHTLLLLYDFLLATHLRSAKPTKAAALPRKVAMLWTGNIAARFEDLTANERARVTAAERQLRRLLKARTADPAAALAASERMSAHYRAFPALTVFSKD